MDVIGRRKSRSEIIEYVRGVPKPCQKNERPTCTAPVKYFQLDAFINSEELYSVRRCVTGFHRRFFCGL